MLVFVLAVFCAGELDAFRKDVDDSYAALTDTDKKFVADFEANRTFAEADAFPLGWTHQDLDMPKRRLKETHKYDVRVLQVIDPHNMLIQVFPDTTVWVSGIDTSGFTDGKTYEQENAPLVRRCGTTKYETALGSRTVEKYCAVTTADVKTVISGRARLAKSRNFKGIGDATFLENAKGVIRLQIFPDGIVEKRFLEFPLEEQEWIRRVAK